MLTNLRRVAQPRGIIIHGGLDDLSRFAVGIESERAAIVFITPRLAWPMQPDEQGLEARMLGLHGFDVSVATEQSRDPCVILRDSRRNVAPPTMAHQNDIGVLAVLEFIQHHLAQLLPI